MGKKETGFRWPFRPATRARRTGPLGGKEEEMNKLATNLYGIAEENVTSYLQDLCMVLSSETCKDYGFMLSFPPRNKDRAELRDVHQNPVMCLPDIQSESKTTNMKNPAKEVKKD